MQKSITENPAITSLTLFETAEYLGYGEGFNPQVVIDNFPPGVVLSMDIAVPESERWFWVLCLCGDAPSSTIAAKAEWEMPGLPHRHRKTVIFFHEGWIGEMVCPYGLKPIREGSVFRMKLANVTDYTGDPDFDYFTPFAQKIYGGLKTVSIAATIFLFRVYKNYFKKMDELIKKAIGLR